MKLKFLEIVVLNACIFSGSYSMSSDGGKIIGRWEGFKERVKRSYLCDNFREVSKGELYRSGALTPERLLHYVKSKGITKVINLRNSQPDAEWWRKIKFTCMLNQVRFIDIETSCYEPVKKETFEELIKIFKEAAGPILIMDKGGVVRTGEIAALWIQVKWEQEEIKNLVFKAIVNALKTRTKPALEQLSVWKGYLFDCCYGKRKVTQKRGDCLAEEIASKLVSSMDLRDPFTSRRFLAEIWDGIYPDASDR